MPKRLAGFPVASPQDEGLSQAPLKKIRSGTRLEVRSLGSCAGVSHLILRRGKCVFSCSDGWANREAGVRFGVDTICRLHGATKALVSAAFLKLVEQGKVKLDDPVAKYISFSSRVASARGRGSRPVKVTPTLRHLLTMTAGLRDTDSPIYSAVIEKVRRGQISDLATYCNALAAIPLQSEPGSWYEYGLSTDFIGRVCEVVSNETLDVFMKKQLLDPLGMKDTHFILPPRKRARVAVLYDCKETPARKRQKTSLPYTPVPWDHPDSAPGILSSSGGALSYKDPGMWGTARDYAHFCQMLLDGGVSSSGTRVLRASTVRAIWSDGLAPFADRSGRLSNWNVDDTEGPPWEGGSWDRCGWSCLNTLVQLHGLPKKFRVSRRGHSMGVGGGGGVYWLADARRQLVALSFQQSFNGGRPEDDGRGPSGIDCVDLAVAAVDEGRSACRRRRTKQQS